jgi:hypothetical protein
LEDRTLPVTGINGFEGIFAGQAGNLRPPDSDGAVGPSSFIEQVNAALAIYDKTTGLPISGGAITATNSFFAPVLLSGALPGDPVTVYNDITRQFAVGVEDFGHNYLYFAISTTSNPTLATSNWQFFRYSLNDPSGGTNSGDYPKIGYNADGFVLSFNQYRAASFNHSAVLAIANDGSSPGIQAVPGGTAHYTMAPASMHSAAPGGPMWFTETPGSSMTPGGSAGNTINVVRMDNVFTATPTYSYTSIPVTAYQPTASPHQPSGQLIGSANLGTRMYFSALRTVGGVTHLVAAHTVGDGTGFSRVRWYDLDVTGTPTLIQQGQVNPGGNIDTLMPCVDISTNGAIGMQYMQSGPNEFVSMFMTGRAAGDAAGTMQTPVVARAGTANLVPTDRIGDYSFTSVDPTDGTFWGANEYGGTAGASPNWRTWIEHFSVGSSNTLTFTMTSSANNIVIRNNPSIPANVQVFNATTSSVLQEVALASITDIVIVGSNITDTLTVSYQFGDPLPSGGLNFQHGTGTDTLNVTDPTSTTGQAFTVAAGSVQRAGSTAITWTPGQINQVIVTGGNGNNTFTVSGASAPGGTTVNAGTGANTVNLLDLAAGNPLTINTARGTGSTILLGDNYSLGAILAPVTVTASTADVLGFTDQNTTTARTFTFNSSSITWTGGPTVNYSGVGQLELSAGSGNNTFNVNGISASAFLYLNGGPGNNTLVGPSANNDLWDLTGANQGFLYGSATVNGVGFLGIGSLTTGTGTDYFVVEDGASVGGNLTGRGIDSLDYTPCTTSVIVDLLTGFATGIGGTLSGFGAVAGGSGSAGTPGLYNLLIGNGFAYLAGGTGRRNILVGGANPSVLVGSDGEDLLIGGSTLYDTQAGLANWQAIATYWAGSDPFATRASNLQSGTGVPRLDATTVTGNGGSNSFAGNGGVALVYTDGLDSLSGFASTTLVSINP